MNFHEKISNFQNSHFSKFRGEIQVLLIIALSLIFMKKYQTLKIHTFPCSDVRFKYYSCAFMNFHEKISNFQSSFFLSSDVRFKYYSCVFMNFHEKISNFQNSFFSLFRCEIQVLFMRFHEFSCKNIKFLKFVLFSVQMLDSSIIHALS